MKKIDSKLSSNTMANSTNYWEEPDDDIVNYLSSDKQLFNLNLEDINLDFHDPNYMLEQKDLYNQFYHSIVEIKKKSVLLDSTDNDLSFEIKNLSECLLIVIRKGLNRARVKRNKIQDI